jgi:hypothetical protein
MDVDRCVSLHNSIAAIHAASPYLHPDCQLQRNFFTAFGAAAVSLRPRLRGSLIAFLEGTDYFTCRRPDETAEVGDGSDGRVVRNTSLTPHLRFPHPDCLFAYGDFAVAEDPVQDCLAADVVLLYHGIADAKWGGMFLDMDSGRAHWASLDSGRWPLPRPQVWVPLADALERYLAAWTAGTYRLVPAPEAPDEPEGCALAQPFGEADLRAAVDEWARLLDAVESRLPAGVTEGYGGDDAHASTLLSEADMAEEDTLRDLFLLPPEDVDEDEAARWAPSFALEFLRRARAPRDPMLRVAPGVGVFSLARMRELLASDDVGRRIEACETRMLEWSERPVLLFPGVGDGSDAVQEWREREMQRVHRDTLLADTPGLYVMPPYDGLQDEVVFVAPRPIGGSPSGATSNDSLFMHSTACPYFAPHRPRLVSVLRCWRRLVESNIVQIGAHGVEGDMGVVWAEAAETAEGRAAFDLGRCTNIRED